MAVDLSKIASNMVRCVASGELCRLWSTELSEIKPQLDANNVTLAGVGLEELGLDEFVKGEFFKGDLYVDAEKKTYQALGFKRYNALTILPSMAAKETRNSISRSNLKKIRGNFKGDGMQTGGLLIVTAGGEKVLFSFKQKSPGDHVDNDVILNALGIMVSATGLKGAAASATKEAGEVKGEGEEVGDVKETTSKPEKVGDEAKEGYGS